MSGDVILKEAEIFGRGSLSDYQPYFALDASVATIEGAFRARFLVAYGIVSGVGGKFEGG